jgi:hypothetical protein
VSEYEPRVRPPRRRRRRPLTPLAAAGLALLVALVFLVGISLGRALEDGPDAGPDETVVRTLRPLPLPPATSTVTVTTP